MCLLRLIWARRPMPYPPRGPTLGRGESGPPPAAETYSEGRLGGRASEGETAPSGSGWLGAEGAKTGAWAAELAATLALSMIVLLFIQGPDGVFGKDSTRRSVEYCVDRLRGRCVGSFARGLVYPRRNPHGGREPPGGFMGPHCPALCRHTARPDGDPSGPPRRLLLRRPLRRRPRPHTSSPCVSPVKTRPTGSS